ncbi:MAG TPA: DUF4351 domain-containing protein [Chthonomonadaceae bacterium]|nr:DUF4351 domain-containing protein [Chthonomonadaceae bacterium]
MDHDSAFKQLLTTFFAEFVELFLLDVAEYLDPQGFEFQSQEVITNIQAREKHIVDLLVKARFRGQATFFLVHVENQATSKSNFPKRMFAYFARLHEKHDLPIYPVVIFSFDKPLRQKPHRYEVAFPDKTVLQFDYMVIQLNRLPWRDFMNKVNPVAAALMAKMRIEPHDRPKVLNQVSRMLATLKLDPARAELIWTFAESYLKLTAEETKQYQREFARLAPEEQETVMQLMSSFRREGIQIGQHQGKESVIVRLMSRRFGVISPEITKRLDALSSDQLDELTDNLLDFTSIADVENWLTRHKPNGQDASSSLST